MAVNHPSPASAAPRRRRPVLAALAALMALTATATLAACGADPNVRIPGRNEYHNQDGGAS